jgi:hypothetical protein
VHKAAWKGHEEALAWMIEDEEGPKLAYQVILFILSLSSKEKAPPFLIWVRALTRRFSNRRSKYRRCVIFTFF